MNYSQDISVNTINPIHSDSGIEMSEFPTSTQTQLMSEKQSSEEQSKTISSNQPEATLGEKVDLSVSMTIIESDTHDFTCPPNGELTPTGQKGVTNKILKKQSIRKKNNYKTSLLVTSQHYHNKEIHDIVNTLQRQKELLITMPICPVYYEADKRYGSYREFRYLLHHHVHSMYLNHYS